MKSKRALACSRCHRTPLRWQRILIQLLVLVTVTLAPLHASRADISELFGDFTLKDELELGRKFSVLIKSRMPLIEDPEVVAYINDIIVRLQTDMKPQPYKFEANVILDNSMNAFAVPGGYLFVHTGLLLELENESELAGILGHELAHITQQHIAGRIAKAKKTQVMGLAGALAGMFIGGPNTSAGLAVGSLAAAQSAMLNYSRQDERESDQVGLIYLVGGGFPPQGMVGGFEAIRKKQWQMGGTLPAYLSTHPDVDERIRSLSDRIQALPADVRIQTENNDRFNRIKALIRARYTDPKIALRHFEINDAPQNCINIMGRGIALARLNRITDAADSFDHALACGSKDFLINREAGSFHYMKGDPDRASKLLQKAILLNPRDYMAFFYYARLLGDRGDIQGASKYFDELLLHLPEDPEIHYYYGRMLGENKLLFKGYLHLAYSSLYKNNKKKTEYHYGLAKKNARTPAEQEQLERFEMKHKERAEFWDKN
ncbi:M48 family metalloprotease [Desulfovibrio mangrovi]|uniref:M48 family metallopeptidase n=1 Tax=Desulfovibrio mangrovi TaxID=2976983 RepID=UPI00224805B4|nr:M48 family metallopeptidase [Desulfovibrio mangrovi]UZP68485.1 M48 family metalloprotease [Desulfovibrio mangrovi]